MGAGLRIAFFGTPEIAVPTLRALLASRHSVVSVVSQPDRGRGRGRKLSPSPVASVALASNVPLLRPERVGDETVEAALRAAAPDLGVVVAFGQFLPKRIRELPRLGYLINAHASLLPRWRGAAALAAAILAGDRRTGISVMRVEREMDAGAVMLVRSCDIEADDDAGSLTERLATLAAEAILEALDGIEAGQVEWRAQDASLATFAPKLERDDAALDFREPAALLARRVRALSPKPGAFTSLRGEPLRILAAHAESGQANAPIGAVRVLGSSGGAPLRIATGDGWLVPTRVQRAGGAVLSVEAFLRGRSIDDGIVLGAAQPRS
jgi:methionyl-tRNA formyltransferase